jgi:GTP-binding protein EngB required for normal cell division
MNEDIGANGFSEHHQRHVRTTFQYIDKLLSEAEHAMTDAGSPSPFQRHSDDTTPIQRKVAHDYILRIREAMRRVMDELNIPPPEPHSGAVWAAAINLMYCSISLNELTPERMRAYGPLPPEAADRLDAIRAELDGLVAKLRTYLGKGAGGDLQQRLQQLGKTSDEIRLLSEIERIITAHGLVEFRGTLSMLLDRMESAAFEVGVFGRVSSGKSSLLNYILQTDVLPIGVTPVTAIPTRISHGPIAEAGIEFAEAQPRIIPLSELPEFATEQQNPGNKKHVTRIFVKLPSDRLAEGVTFVDTPGLGSLAVAGAEETIAYLPRCDLGIVLIDASAGLMQDDLVVVQALYQAGASAMILVSKADLFSPVDRQQMVEYVKRNLRSQLGVEPPVHAVSVFGADAALCDRWFETELRPFLAQHHELAITSQKRKIGGLREAVIGALERRLFAAANPSGGGQVQSEVVSEGSATLPNEATEALRNGDRVLERAQGESFFLTRKIPKMQRAIIDVAAERIATALIEPNETNAASILSETLMQMIAEPVAATRRSIEQTRNALAKAMDVVVSASGQDASEELPRPTGMPMMDVNEISRKIVVEKPRMLSLLGKGVLAPHIRRKLETEYDRALLDFLSLYANRLRRWMEQSINALRSAFTAFADMHRANFEAPPAASATDTSAVQNDLRILREWETAAETLAVHSS